MNIRTVLFILIYTCTQPIMAGRPMDDDTKHLIITALTKNFQPYVHQGISYLIKDKTFFVGNYIFFEGYVHMENGKAITNHYFRFDTDINTLIETSQDYFLSHTGRHGANP